MRSETEQAPAGDANVMLMGPPILDQGHPDIDSRAFRTCLGQFATGVTVMATQLEGRQTGVTVGSFSSLSLDPPLVIWSIARTSRSSGTFRQAAHFTINVLAEDQINVAQHFSGPSVNKFSDIEWFKAHNECPVLPGIVALFECEREAIYEGGDHWIIVGKVTRFIRYSGRPLLFVQSRYAVHQPHAQLQVPADAAPSTAREESKTMAALTSLLQDATRLRVGGFDKHRRVEGVNYLQSRVLFALLVESEQNVADLADQIFATPNDCTDAVDELAERGLVARNSKGRVSLTDAGSEKCRAIQIRYDQYEAECLSGFSEEQIETVREFLKAFIRKFEDANSAL